ncbi:hypothetical protein [Cystobacter fuscus]|uniref:hypothetical protein n=1 Tax=Cystobacter fuscus TaxID=43 RepID=UPI002B2ED95C|nr:hypothetical protein F0U63_43035 [Cystobacter fuscus]
MDRKFASKHLLFPFLAALLLGFAVIFFALWTDVPMPAPAPEQPRVTARPPEQPARPLSPQPATAPLPLEPSRPVVVSDPLETDTTPPLLAKPRSPLDSLRQRVMVAHPDIAQFRQLQRKVLLKPQEKEMLRDMYKDRELIEAAKQDLLAADEETFTEEGQFKRLYRVEYLGMGLEWKENPERETLLKTVEEVILAKNIQSEQGLDLRRSLSGDKVELFMVMLYNDRKRAEELLASVQGTDLEKLLKYSMLRYDALWAIADKK